jgi:hypothetical protein
MLASRGDRPWRFSALYAAAYENKIKCPVSYNQQFEIEQTMSSLSFEADSKFIGGLVRAGTRIARQAPRVARPASGIKPIVNGAIKSGVQSAASEAGSQLVQKAFEKKEQQQQQQQQ